MAQGGHQWSPGTYDPNIYPDAPARFDSDDAINYQQFPPTRTGENFLSNFPMPYVPASSMQFSNNAFPNDDRESPEMRPPSTNGYSNSNFLAPNHPTSDGRLPYSDHLSSYQGRANPYGTIGGSAYAAPPQHQTYQAQYRSPSVNNHHVPGAYNNAAWHGQVPSSSQGQYNQQEMQYDSQGGHHVFQNGIQAPSRQISTPPSAQTTQSHFVPDHGSRGAFQTVPTALNHVDGEAHLSQQPNLATGNQYQQQHQPPTQGQYVHGQYPALPIQPSQPATGYQNQVQQPRHQDPMAGQTPLLMPPVYQSPQPSAVQVSRMKSIAQIPRSSSPAVLPANVAPAPLLAASPGSQAPIQQTVSNSRARQAGQAGQAAQAVPAVESQRDSDPTAGMKPVPGCPNLFFSDVPESQSESSKARKNSEKPYRAQYNKKYQPLLPGLDHPLPCEILRDYQDRKDVVNNSSLDDKMRQAAIKEMKKLDEQMTSLTGKKAQDLSKDLDPTKAPTVRKSKARTATTPGQDLLESSSEEVSDSDDEESERDKKAREIKMAKPPSDRVRAVEQETIKIVWEDPAEQRASNAVSTAIEAFASQINGLWTKVKSVKEKHSSASATEKKLLQRELDIEAECLLTAIQTAIEYGSDWNLKNMGGKSKLISQLCNALRWVYLSSNPNGPFAKAILRLLSQAGNMDKGFLLNTIKLDRIRDKYIKDLDEESRGYFTQIFAKANELSKKAEDTSGSSQAKTALAAPKKASGVMAKDLLSASKLKKPAIGGPSKAQSSVASASEPRKASNGTMKTPASASPLKRPRDIRDDESDIRAPKKFVLESASKRRRDDDGDLRTSKKVALDGSTGAHSVAKPVSGAASNTTPVATAQPRPRSSGSILPGRSRPVVKPVPKKVEPQQSFGSTISGLLAEIEKPTPAPKPREEPAKAPETPEEKERRLRKEARRGLRVVWKPDHELTEVRIFQHDSAEDEGRANSMIRDAKDNRSEGQMLKQNRGVEEDEDDTSDGDEEQGKQREVSLRPWGALSATDLTSIDAKQRDKSFVTRGGHVTFYTDQQKFMEDYERRELMAVYTSVSDIPTTPKSPRKAAEVQSEPTKAVHLPSDNPQFQEIHRRWADAGQFGAQAATQLALSRLRSKNTGNASELDRVLNALKKTSGTNHSQQPAPYSLSANMSQTPAAPAPSSTLSAEERCAEVFRLLYSGAFKQWLDPDPYDPAYPKTQRRHDYPDPKVQRDADAIEEVAAQLAGKLYPAADPPEHMKGNTAYVKEWTDGYSRDMVAKAKKEAEERAKKLGDDYARQIATASQLPAQQSAPQASQDPNQVATNAAWAAYLAQYGQQQLNAYAQQQVTQQAPAQQQDYQQYASILQQAQALQAAQASPALPPQQSYQQSVAQDSNAQLQALLSALGGQPSQLQAAASAGAQNNDLAAAFWKTWQQPQAQAQSAYHSPQQQSQHQYQQRDNDYDFDRTRGNRGGNSFGGESVSLDYGPSDYDTRDKGSRGRKDKDNFHGRGKENSSIKEHTKGINRALIGTKPCTFWAQGKCSKGDQCTFRHDPNDLK